MVVGDVGVLEAGAVLELDVEARPEFIEVDSHLLGIYLGEDKAGLIGRCLRLVESGPIPDAEGFADPPDFFPGYIFRQVHGALLFSNVVTSIVAVKRGKTKGEKGRKSVIDREAREALSSKLSFQQKRKAPSRHIRPLRQEMPEGQLSRER